MNLTEGKLREEAEARVGFKNHLRTYIVITLAIWLVWFFFRAQYGYFDGYWPIYPTLGWGFGIVMHYLGVYRNNSSAVEKEIEKMKKERGLN